MRRVLFVTRKWPPAVGGMETYSVRLSEELAKRADLQTIVLPGRKNGQRPTVRALLGFGIGAAIRAVARAPRIDVLHVGDLAIWPLAWLVRLRNRKVLLFASAHGSDVAFSERPGIGAWLYRKYMRLGTSLIGRRAIIIANSNATATKVRNLGYPCVSIVPLAADACECAGEARTHPERYVLFVGRLIAPKGCSWFIRHVLPRLPDSTTLKVAGTIGECSEGKALNHPRVDYLGPVFGERLAKLRRQAIAVIVPNIDVPGGRGFEGFGLTAVEAAVAGGVVLAADAYGLRDAVRAGETGFLLPSGDASAWVRKIEEVAEWDAKDRQAFTERARQVATSHFSWQRVAADTLAAYEQAFATRIEAPAECAGQGRAAERPKETVNP